MKEWEKAKKKKERKILDQKKTKEICRRQKRMVVTKATFNAIV